MTCEVILIETIHINWVVPNCLLLEELSVFATLQLGIWQTFVVRALLKSFVTRVVAETHWSLICGLVMFL